MDSFQALRRRTTDLLQSLPHNLPAVHMPNVSMPAGLKSPPTHTVTGSWEKVEMPPIPRSSHSVDVVSGSAYIFGGEINVREPVDNAMHVVSLPLSLSASTDYHTIKAAAAKTYIESAEKQEMTNAMTEVPLTAASERGPTTEWKGKGKEITLEDVPTPRVGHATAVIGSRIFLFGGRGGPDMAALEEGGRVWIFDTRSHTWSFLDPAPPAAGAIARFPPSRSYHCATATDMPKEFNHGGPKRTESWHAWAVGDSETVGIPQAPIIGNVAAGAVDEEDAGYGTLFIHGGCLSDGDRTNDFWAFNVHTHVWTELPGAPGPGRGGTAICTSKDRLFRFGGFDGKTELGGQLDFIHLDVEPVSAGAPKKGDVSIAVHRGWQTIAQGKPASVGEAAQAIDVAEQEWPGNRSVLGLEAVTTGGGREYLILTMGEHDPSTEGHAAAGKFRDDVWVFQVPPTGMSTASVRDAMWSAIGRKTGEGRWTKVNMSPYDDDNSDEMPAARGWLATSPINELEGTGILILGGLGEDNTRLGDGWILRLN